MDSEFIDLRMRRATRLVIFEFLAQSCEERKKTGKVASDSADGSLVLKEPEPVEKLPLLRLEAEIERTLPEIFAPEYLHFDC
jgi:hypothetical protein